MKRVLPILVILCLPAAVFGQTFTPEQSQVLDDIGACWDAWYEAAAAGNYDAYHEQCVASDDATFMWADGGLYGVREWRRGLTNHWFMPNHHWQWSVLRPWRVVIESDIALVFFSPIWVKTDPEGTVTEEPSQRRMEVYKRLDGKWKFLGGLGLMSSNADG